MLRDLEKIAFNFSDLKRGLAIFRIKYFCNVLVCKQNGFASIVEIIVTSVIFVIAAVAVLSTVSQFRPHGKESSQKMEAVYIGKGIVDDFRRQISAEDWNTGNLAVGTYGFTVGDYTVNYIISEPIPDLRHLTMNISWPDP